MKLVSARVTHFRSVDDSGEFSLEDLTCLVGKNEAGKTAILQAFAGLNPHPATPFQYERERDYPKRFLARYDERHPDSDPDVIVTKWELSDDTVARIKSKFGDKAVTGNKITICRGYEDKSTRWTLPIDHEAAVEHLIATSNFSAPELSQIGSPRNSNELIAKLTPLAESNEKHKTLLDKMNGFPNLSVLSSVRSICEPDFPKFMYFSNYDRMDAAVQLEGLKPLIADKTLFSRSDLRGQRLFLEFLEFAGVTVDEILGAETFEDFNSKLQAASNVITDEILEYWTQNQDIEVRINVQQGKSGDTPPFNSGTVGRARIYNALHKSDTDFSERSAGFTWFFSFLVKFDRVKKESEGPIALLLDEPGLTLHGLAQEDLLRYFDEKLVPHHQLIYSTHSPFMVPSDRLSSCRIVEDKVVVDKRGRRTPDGTKVRSDILATDRDSVFPLQGALGYSITQSLFVGKNTVLVEGPSDILYLKAFSRELFRRGRIALNPQFVICPSGGLDKINAFASLFSGNGINVISLSDFSKKDKKKIESLRQSEILKSGNVLTFEEFTGKEESDVEDVISAELLADIVSQAYELEGEHLLTAKKLLDADQNTCRLVKKTEAYFRVLPDTIPMYDHFTPSSWLIENMSILQGNSKAVMDTLDIAEKIFAALNERYIEQ